MEQGMYGNLIEEKLTIKVLTTIIIESSDKQYIQGKQS